MDNKFLKKIGFFAIIGIVLLVSRFLLSFIFFEKSQAFAELEKANLSAVVSNFTSTEQNLNFKSSLPFLIINTPVFSTSSTSDFSVKKTNNTATKIQSQSVQRLTLTIHPIKYTLLIPAIDLRTTITPMDYLNIEDNDLLVSNGVVGTLQESVLNNFILFGQADLCNSVFGNLREVRVGDEIFIESIESTQRYIVVKNMLADFIDLQYIMSQTTPQVALITHENEKKRIIVGLF